MVHLLLLLLGLYGLWVGSGWIIRGSVSIAKSLGVSDFAVGAVVLSIGTDLPELSIAIGGALQNLSVKDSVADIIVGSALGSGLGQIGFVLGVVGMFGTLTLSRIGIRQHGSVLLGSLVLLGILALDGVISRLEGIILTAAYASYIFLLFFGRRNGAATNDPLDKLSSRKAWLAVIVGLIVVIVGAELTIHGAEELARSWQVEQSVVAILLIGLGTSLPELSISLSAIIRRRSELSIGNLLGSNIFDTMVPVGVAAAIAGLKFDAGMLQVELPYLFFLTAVVLVFFAIGERLRRREAAIVLALYLVYALFRITSG